MKKTILFDKEAREKMNRGVNVLADAVSATMGARGRNVVIQKEFKAPFVTKDGVTVAKEIELADEVENLGAQMLREVALNTNRDAGDGTTTATVLARSIYNIGLRHLGNGYNPIIFKRGMDRAVDRVVYTLKGMAVPVKDKEKITQIATISANNDVEMGKLIASAIEQVGLDGVVTVEKSKNGNTYIEKVDGIQFNRSYMSPYFITNMAKATVELTDKVHVLIFQGTIKKLQDILKVLEHVSTQNENLLIICDEFEQTELSTLIYNKMQGSLSVAVVKSPGYGDQRIKLCQDIATLTGATIVDPEKGFDMKTLGTKQLGRCQKVVIDKNTTTIVNGAGTQESINNRIQELRDEMETTEQFQREKLQERIANLLGGVAIVNVGGSSEVEIEEKKYRIEDALNATRAGIEEGVVAGGGVALIKCINELDTVEYDNEDERIGIQIIKEALESPIRTIISNAGESPDYAVTLIKNHENPEFGYNVLTNRFELLFTESGIIDPVKVTRLALTNANSVASLMLTTQVVVIDVPDEVKN